MTVRRTITSALLAAAVLAPGIIKAEDAKWYDTTTISGFADAYYKYNFDGRHGSTTATTDKVFDKHQNTFALGGGKLGISSGPAVVNLYFGDYGSTLQSTVPTESLAVGEAYITQALGPVSFTLGRYFTHVGYEVVDAPANFNYTRALLYNQVPFFHQGAKFTYSPMEGLGLLATIDNGPSINYAANESTGAGAQVSWTGTKDLSLYLNYYYEPTQATGLATVWEKKHYFDVVASYGIMEGLTFAGEYLYWTQIGATDTDTNGEAIGTAVTDPSTGKKVAYSPKTQGYAVYLDYATPMEGLSVTPRFEALYQPDNGGVTSPEGQTLFDYTLTLRYVKGALTNFLEFRTDYADDAIYPAAVNDPGNAKYNEMALTYAVAYKY